MKQPTDNQQITNQQPTDNQRITTDKKVKNVKNIKKYNNMEKTQKPKESSSYFLNLSSEFYYVIDKYIDLRSAEGFIKSSKSGYKKKLIENIEKDTKCFRDVEEYVEKANEKKITPTVKKVSIIDNGLNEIQTSLIKDVFYKVDNLDEGLKVEIHREAEDITKKEFKKDSISRMLEPAVRANVVNVYKSKLKEGLFEMAAKSDFQCDSEITDIDIKSMSLDFSKANNITVKETEGLIKSGKIKPFNNYFSLYHGESETEYMLEAMYKNIKP